MVTSLLALSAHATAATAATAATDAKPAQAPPQAAPARMKRLLVLDPVANHVDKETVQIVSGLLTVEMAALGGVEVISGADMQRMLELEARKVDMGCSAESCLSEIADAFGTDLVVFGNIGRLGGLYILTLNLFETATAKSQGRVSMRTRAIEALPDILSRELPTLLAAVRPLPGDSTVSRATSVSADAHTAQTRPTDRQAFHIADHGSRVALTTAGVVLSLGGLAGAVLGLVPVVQHELAVQEANAVRQTDWEAYQQAQRAAGDAREAYQTLGLPALGAGGAALTLGTLLWVGAFLLAPGETAE